MLRNKRGDITVTLLVLGVLAVCAFALITFFISSANLSKDFKGVGFIEKANQDYEQRGECVELEEKAYIPFYRQLFENERIGFSVSVDC